MAGPGYDAYKLGFQISPIILTQGIASGIPGGLLPIIALTEAANFANGLLSGDIGIDLDDFFAHYEPTPGTTLISNEVATYPFANQTVAANSIIAEPLMIGMTMVCPARDKLGYFVKLGIMSALVKSLTAHNASGGTYTVVTPSYIYTNCLMRSMTDVSGAQTKQKQSAWQFEFMQPLLTAAQAASVQNSLMGVLTDQTKLNGPPTWSGLGTVLASPFQLAGQSVVGAAKAMVGGI